MKHPVRILVALLIGLALAMLAISICIYFGYSKAYETNAQTLSVVLLGQEIYHLTASPTGYDGLSRPQTMGLICGLFSGAALVLELLLSRLFSRRKRKKEETQ